MSTAADEAPRKRWRRPTLAQISALVVLLGGIGGIVEHVFDFVPGWRPQPSPDVGKAAISDKHVIQPFTFRRYLQRQGISQKGLSPKYLARRGVLIEFHYEITGLRGKKLPLRWELSNAATHDLIAEDNALTITPSNNDEGADWSVWVPAPRKGRMYYVTVTIYQSKGPPYELKHFNSPKFRGLAT